MTIRDIPIDGWPRPFRPDPKYWGPDLEDACPCGSLRRARNCHARRGRGWIVPPPGPLLNDDFTGYANPGCYARISEDCTDKLSKEHWLSNDILKEIGAGKPIRISGASWQAGREDLLPPQALGSNVLCDRHNSALSPLDQLAGHVFRVVHHYQADLRSRPDPHGHEFALFSGNQFERWMLKVLWGGVAAATLGPSIHAVRTGIDLKALALFLFRGGSLPKRWGFYMAGRPGVEFSGEAAAALEPHTGPDGTLWEGSLEFGAVALRFGFGVPTGDQVGEVELRPHPEGIVIRSEGTDAQKVLAFGWEGETSGPVFLTRTGEGKSAVRPSAL